MTNPNDEVTEYCFDCDPHDEAHCECVNGRVPYHLISPYTGKGVAKSIACDCECHR